MLVMRTLLGVATVLVMGMAPALVGDFGRPGGAPAAARAALAAGPGFDNDNDDRTELEGQVLPVQCPAIRGDEPRVEAACAGVPEGTLIPAINTDSTPPSLFVHNLDGAVWVTFDDPAELDAFHEGDYVRIEGRRVHTFLFRGREGSTDDNDND